MNPIPCPPVPVLICACEGARVFSKERAESLEQCLRQTGRSVEIVPDLCDLAARRDPRLRDAAAQGWPIAACHARAVRWLFHQAQAPLAKDARLFNLRETAPEEIAAALGAVLPEPPQAPAAAPGPPPFAVPAELGAWFPVIDYDRCVQCMQCLGFCLFGVYATDDSGQVAVQNPGQCKPGCPACARVCPESAIIFPKFKSGPISGAPDSKEHPPAQKIDISFLLGGDPLGAIRSRSARARTRFSKDRSAETALSERRKHLEESGLIALDIPREVLASLPSPDEIALKAKEAAARAQAALEARKKP